MIETINQKKNVKIKKIKMKKVIQKEPKPQKMNNRRKLSTDKQTNRKTLCKV